MRVSFGTLLAATVLALCLGLQILEASGHWDRTLKDTGDEAVIVSVTLCIGAAFTIARAVGRSLPLPTIQAHIGPILPNGLMPLPPSATSVAFDASPPPSLRI